MNLPQTLIIESNNTEKGIAEALKRARNNLCVEESRDQACGECASCKRLSSENHPDFILVEKPNDKKNISVETVREKIISKINSRPLVSEITVIIIINAQYLSRGAQNALLKTLEEPPSYVRIILTVDKTGHLLETITSRSQIEHITCPPQNEDESIELISKVIDMSIPQRFRYAKKITEKDKKAERKDARHTLESIDMILGGLRFLLRNSQAKASTQQQLVSDIEKILEDRRKIHYNANKLLVLENILLQTLDPITYKKLLPKR